VQITKFQATAKCSESCKNAVQLRNANNQMAKEERNLIAPTRKNSKLRISERKEKKNIYLPANTEKRPACKTGRKFY
jgi:hypothetical protein